jgi:hypothetical protein
MPAASSYAGSRGVTMSFLPNARRPSLAEHTNVLIAASFPDPLTCGPSVDTISASPFVPQIPLTSTSRSPLPIFYTARPGRQHNGNATCNLAPSSPRYRDIWGRPATRGPERHLQPRPSCSYPNLTFYIPSSLRREHVHSNCRPSIRAF